MSCDVRWTRFGDPALDALADVVAGARGVDPLAPVTVVTPSPSVAVATRRALARRVGAVAGVGFHALGAVAEQLAAPALAGAGLGAGIDREVVVTAVRVALAEAPGAFGPIADHRVTWERIADAVTEIDPLGDEALARVRAAGRVPAEVARLREVVRRRVGPLGPDAVVRLAAEVVDGGGSRVAALGSVVVHLPHRFSGAELILLGVLARHVPVVLVLGATGDSALDAAQAEHVAPLARTAPPAVEPPAATEVVSANDIDDEVRVAVRRLLGLADAGTPLHRMALVHPSGPPYAGVVADVLRATEVPFSGPSTRRLAQTVPGRVLLGLLAVDASRFGRQEVVDLWATGVVVDDAARPLPVAAFDERSRTLGVVRDAARWHELIQADDTRLRQRLDAAAGDDASREWIEHRLDLDARLRAAVATLQELCADVPDGWADIAGWAGRVLDRLCAPRSQRTSWPDAELDAEEAVRVALARLAALEDLEPSPAVGVVRDTIRTVLEAPAPRPAGPGAGLLVTTIDAPPLVPLDAVAVVGLIEGQLPRIAGDDALLGDRVRAEAGLAGVDDQHRRQRRAFLASLASASQHRVVTHARNDQRSGRALVPSRWLVEAVERATGTRPDTEALMAGHHVPGVTLVASHGAALLDVASGGTAALHADEHALAALVRHGSLDGHPAAADPVLAAGADALRQRRARAFTRFDGNLGGDGVDVTALGVLSPTSVETYARCPRRWFFAQALGLRSLDRPEEIERIDARERGTLAHAVLERFFAEAIASGSAPAPGEVWSAAARDRLRAIADEECDAAEARGITGHPRWWDHDRAEIHRVLQRTLTGDEEQRRRFGTAPAAVELTFGRGGLPPLAVDLGDGRSILLAGQADRVDLGTTPAGTRVVVWDYKYSGPRQFDVLNRPEDNGGDPLAGGTKIQLVAYAMAAEQAAGLDLGEGPIQAHAYYWFLRPPHTNDVRGYPVDDDLRRRFTRVLGVVADAIGAGRFPARPGPYQYHLGNFEHCAWCEFDDICPRDRDEEWERVRDEPALAAVRGLAEEGSRWVLDEGEGR
ncbi:MAG TPA: PD-(D/E)XK nuclease family protein [Acidimicrobiales bacterium]|nr:PD-(D/E)XK nuclease family protein [Acidimicrobiales bacterium]